MIKILIKTGAWQYWASTHGISMNSFLKSMENAPPLHAHCAASRRLAVHVTGSDSAHACALGPSRAREAAGAANPVRFCRHFGWTKFCFFTTTAVGGWRALPAQYSTTSRPSRRSDALEALMAFKYGGLWAQVGTPFAGALAQVECTRRCGW